MVALLLTIRGRPVILIANDITIKAGSFSVSEDALFLRASRYARRHRLPRIYIAANSGARIGIAEEVLHTFDVDWVNPDDHRKGFRDLLLPTNSGAASSCLTDSEGRLRAIIGKPNAGIGVENLAGSGAIAGETGAAYDETFTLTYVSSRTVGIGAYLARLGQRVIQVPFTLCIQAAALTFGTTERRRCGPYNSHRIFGVEQHTGSESVCEQQAIRRP